MIRLKDDDVIWGILGLIVWVSMIIAYVLEVAG